MKCDFTFDDYANLKEFRFIPDEEEGEDEAELYRLSRLLKVKNPVGPFTVNAKKGQYNALSDADYDNLLKRLSLITYYCFDHTAEVNPVKLASRLLELILDQKYTSLSEEAYSYIKKEKARHEQEKK